MHARIIHIHSLIHTRIRIYHVLPFRSFQHETLKRQLIHHRITVYDSSRYLFIYMYTSRLCSAIRNFMARCAWTRYINSQRRIRNPSDLFDPFSIKIFPKGISSKYSQGIFSRLLSSNRSRNYGMVQEKKKKTTTPGEKLISPRVSAIPFTWKSGGKSSKGRSSFFETFLGLRSSSFRRKPVHLASTRGGKQCLHYPVSAHSSKLCAIPSIVRPKVVTFFFFLSLSLFDPFRRGEHGWAMSVLPTGISAVFRSRRPTATVGIADRWGKSSAIPRSNDRELIQRDTYLITYRALLISGCDLWKLARHAIPRQLHRCRFLFSFPVSS